MERPGEKLKRVRERLKLTYRDVVEASQTIARRRSSEEFLIALSRLADIENKGTVPTIYRLYSLCAIYRLEFAEVVSWYGAPAYFVLGAVHAVAFWFTVSFFTPFILLVAFFNERRRLLHDIMLGTVIINNPARAALRSAPAR